MDASRWYAMSVSEQILNIGGEVQRAVQRKEKGDPEGARDFLKKAMEWLELSKSDPKNKNRVEELTLAGEEVEDYFNLNLWKNDSKSIMGYWDSFLSANF